MTTTQLLLDFGITFGGLLGFLFGFFAVMITYLILHNMKG